MKDFIKESLRLKLEAKSARHTSSNTHQDKGLGDTKDIAYLDEREWDEEIEQAVEIYREYHSIMGSTDKGKGLYEFVIYRKNGKFALKSKENSVGTKREAGDVNNSYMYIKASKPDIDIPELRELMAPKIGKRPEKYVISATDIAYVKILALMGNTIKQFIGGSLGYTTSDAQKISTEKTAPENKYRFKKLHYKRKDVLSINGPDLSNSDMAERLLRQYKTQLGLAKNNNDQSLKDSIEDLKIRLNNLGVDISKYEKEY